MTTTPSTPSWLRLRFSLRALLIAMTLLAVAIGGLRRRSIAQHYAARQLKAAGAILSLNGSIAPQSNWEWLVFGDDRYDFLGTIAFDERTVSAKDLSSLHAFEYLYDLHLTNCHLDAQATETLGSLQMLRSLQVSGGSLNGVEAVAWERLQHLNWLVLWDIDLSRFDGQGLSQLEDCRIVSLRSSTLTDQQLQLLKLPSLQMLYLSGAGISDAGLAFLAHSPGLKDVTINKTSITGTGLSFVHPAAKIGSLDLNQGEITRPGLDAIAKLRSLTILQIRSTTITDEEIEKFRIDSPGCVVVVLRK
jgi:hypothetical protein